MPKHTISVNISDWTVDDIDRFAPHVSFASKRYETCNIFTDIELLTEYLDKKINEPASLNCGRWHESVCALYPRENAIEVLIVLRRVRLLPNENGCVNFIKWEKA